jgi:hypothetical protein
MTGLSIGGNELAANLQWRKGIYIFYQVLIRDCRNAIPEKEMMIFESDW